MLLGPGICFRGRISVELLEETSAIPGCRQGILPGLTPRLAEGSAMGKAVLSLPC